MAVAFETLKIPKSIYQRLKKLAQQRNVELVELIDQLITDKQHNPDLPEPEQSELAPIYQIHEHAVDMGIRDLAENVDKYLYDTETIDE